MALSRRATGLSRLLAALLLACATAPAAAERATPFDYWILSLSWSPQFCKSNLSDEQCEHPRGFIVHGLWPQYERGYPESCGRERVPKDLVQRMLPLMPSNKLIQKQWRKHGSCSGMDMTEYFMTVERAHRAVVLPPVFRDPDQALPESMEAVEQAFVETNPRLTPDAIAVQCRGSWLNEVRICFDRDFQPRACGSDVQDRCRSSTRVEPVRSHRLVRP